MKVWDLPTRLYHWLQAILCFLVLISGFTGNGPHELLGSALMVLIIWRIGWGIIGSETSRFSQFVKSPNTVWRYFQKRYSHHVGHNPAGGWMVITLLLMLAAQCLTGMFLAGFFDDVITVQGILADSATLGTIHAILARGLILLIAAHLTAITIYKIARKPLVKAMFTGYQEKQDVNLSVHFAPLHRAVVLLILSGVIMIILMPA